MGEAGCRQILDGDGKDKGIFICTGTEGPEGCRKRSKGFEMDNGLAGLV
jgi:hypothetical protein